MISLLVRSIVSNFTSESWTYRLKSKKLLLPPLGKGMRPCNVIRTLSLLVSLHQFVRIYFIILFYSHVVVACYGKLASEWKEYWGNQFYDTKLFLQFLCIICMYILCIMGWDWSISRYAGFHWVPPRSTICSCLISPCTSTCTVCPKVRQWF